MLVVIDLSRILSIRKRIPMVLRKRRKSLMKMESEWRDGGISQTVLIMP